eukprot:TRINITY_DN10130_c0_g1_i4.p1 TRINITY_DN10130_c0_g1~~TRINITY_DN10130_c0_g1_i4.p1  ORF type:complete len:427 (+),score=51.51 TRINITY_DN10130_c0_g1_i4:97-1377(+)
MRRNQSRESWQIETTTDDNESFRFEGLTRQLSLLKHSIDIGDTLADFEVHRVLGKGGYGIVYKVKSLLDQQIYVMKTIDLSKESHERQLRFLHEVKVLRRLKHPNVIQYHNAFIENGGLHIIMEYAKRGDLHQLMERRTSAGRCFTEKELWSFAFDIFHGVSYLHRNSIIHCDLKPHNVFIDNCGRLKIGDFGLSKILEGELMLDQVFTGTPLFHAPEIVNRQPFDFKIDVWAIGVILYLLATNRYPFAGDSAPTVAFLILHQVPRPLPHNTFSSEFRMFVMKLLQKNPAQRPKANEVFTYFPKLFLHPLMEDTHRMREDDEVSSPMHEGFERSSSECSPRKSPPLKLRPRPIVVEQESLEPVENMGESQFKSCLRLSSFARSTASPHLNTPSTIPESGKKVITLSKFRDMLRVCLLYTSPSPRDS